MLGALGAAEDAEAGVVGVAVGQGFDLGGELVAAGGEGSDVVGAVGWAGVEDAAEAVLLGDEVLDGPLVMGSPVSMARRLSVSNVRACCTASTGSAPTGWGPWPVASSISAPPTM